jgi:hypothetical protein
VTNQGLTAVPRSATEVIQIAAGTFHSLALRADGSVVGWGYNGENRATAPKDLTGVVSIAAGRDHSIALKKNGRVVCWGANDTKQCEVPPSLDRIIAIAAGDFYTLALKSDGTVVAWGDNSIEQCSVPTGLNQVVAIAAGHGHSLALKADGTAVAWGNNAASQIDLPQNPAQLIAISAGGMNSALLEANGAYIGGQPRSQTVLAGRDVEFTVAVSGAGLRYQWYYNGVAITGGRVAGSTQATLRLSAVERADAGAYAVDVYEGDNLVRSANALLVVRFLVQASPPSISGGIATLRFRDTEGEYLSAEDAELYQMQWSADLENWRNLDRALTGDAGSLVGTDFPGAGIRFYRLIPKN